MIPYLLPGVVIVPSTITILKCCIYFLLLWLCILNTFSLDTSVSVVLLYFKKYSVFPLVALEMDSSVLLSSRNSKETLSITLTCPKVWMHNMYICSKRKVKFWLKKKKMIFLNCFSPSKIFYHFCHHSAIWFLYQFIEHICCVLTQYHSFYISIWYE